MKNCTRCLREKAEEEFGCNKRNKDGLANWCRLCHNEYHRNLGRSKGRVEQKRIKHMFIDGVESKKCSGCKVVLPLLLFTKNSWVSDGFNSWCRDCAKKRREVNIDETREKGKLRQRNYVKRMVEENPDWVRNQSRKFAPQERLRIKEDRKKNPEKYRSQELKRYYKTIKPNLTKMLCLSMSGRIRISLHGNKNRVHWETVVGYTLGELLIRLESTWIEGMSWKNYGKGIGKWSIDHTKPITHFTFSSYEDKEFKDCWALTNLKAMWDIDNNRKGNRWIG